MKNKIKAYERMSKADGTGVGPGMCFGFVFWQIPGASEVAVPYI